MKIKFITFLIVLFICSCSDWETATYTLSSGNIKSANVILIEEFTGSSCPNCPTGTAELENIRTKYPDNIVVIGVHSRFLASPVNSSDPDLRTPDADALEKFIGNYVGKPEASINRILFPNKTMIRVDRPDTWITYVESELLKENKASINITKEFNDTSRELKIKVNVIALVNIDFPLYINVAITESEIQAAQKHQTGTYENYIHHHVLHKILSNINGGDLLTNTLNKSNSSSKEYTFTLPAEAKFWKAENCHIVAFVSKDPNSKEVLQASQINVK